MFAWDDARFFLAVHRTGSLTAAGRQLGVNQSTVSRLENYHDNPTLDSLLRVADALELNLGEVLKQAIENMEKRGR